MAKILVVDDEADFEILIRQKFRKHIREQIYEFIFALNGRHALEQLELHRDVDIVLSDINMPDMDGLTLLSRLCEKHNLLKSVIISAYGDMENIRTAMNRGAFDFVTKPVDFNDLELTIDKALGYVRHMKETLRAIKENNILKMYVDENVLNFMNSREYESTLMVNETMDVTVAFIDICGFTAISENAPPDQVIKLLNSYFDVMVKEIIAHNGYIDKFMGDAIMAVFRSDHHLDRAIEACLAVKSKVSQLTGTIDHITYSPQVSIGINSGEVVCGNIGSSSLRRLDYTVIGDVVNIAQRLQSIAGPGQIFINDTSFQIVKESFKCKKISQVSLKNKTQPVVIYEVME